MSRKSKQPHMFVAFLRDLSFPVADFREVKMKILEFRADVKLVKPEEQKQKIPEEIEKMQGAYGVTLITSRLG